jgi:hypothetical protein
MRIVARFLFSFLSLENRTGGRIEEIKWQKPGRSVPSGLIAKDPLATARGTDFKY